MTPAEVEACRFALGAMRWEPCRPRSAVGFWSGPMLDGWGFAELPGRLVLYAIETEPCDAYSVYGLCLGDAFYRLTGGACRAVREAFAREWEACP